MGSSPQEPGRGANEGPQCGIELEAFWIGRCEVTWDEYDLWAQGASPFEPSAKQAAGSSDTPLIDAIARPSIGYVDMSMGMGRGRRPAAGMSQLAAKLYCQWLSTITGRYYRLPTEAEWEYACRAGTQTSYSFGNSADRVYEYAWFEANSDFAAQIVGRKQPNAWGLYDMHGNVAEWVIHSFASDNYPSPTAKALKSPVAIPALPHSWIVRGGSFDDPPDRLRSSARRFSDAGWQRSDPNLPKSIWWLRDVPFVGFRVVRPSRLPTSEQAARYNLDPLQQQQLEGYLKRSAPPR
jgi:formylglycine-generating enzyme required for sulfatase activity